MDDIDRLVEELRQNRRWIYICVIGHMFVLVSLAASAPGC